MYKLLITNDFILLNRRSTKEVKGRFQLYRQSSLSKKMMSTIFHSTQETTFSTKHLILSNVCVNEAVQFAPSNLCTQSKQGSSSWTLEFCMVYSVHIMSLKLDILVNCHNGRTFSHQLKNCLVIASLGQRYPSVSEA